MVDQPVFNSMFVFEMLLCSHTHTQGFSNCPNLEMLPTAKYLSAWMNAHLYTECSFSFVTDALQHCAQA